MHHFQGPSIIPEIAWAMMPIIILLNLTIMAVILLTPKLHITGNYFVFAIAFCDFLTGCITIPMQLNDWNPRVRTILDTLRLLISLGLDCACTYDRFCAIIWAYGYEEAAPRKKALVIMGVVGAVSFLIAALPIIWFQTVDDHILVVHRGYLALICGIVVLLTAIQLMFYAIIFGVGRNHLMEMKLKKKLQEQFLEKTARYHPKYLRNLQENIKLAKCFLLVMLTYFISWLPVGYIKFKQDVLGHHNSLPDWIHEMSHYSEFAACILHPILYILFQKNMRNAIGAPCNKVRDTENIDVREYSL